MKVLNTRFESDLRRIKRNVGHHTKPHDVLILILILDNKFFKDKLILVVY